MRFSTWIIAVRFRPHQELADPGSRSASIGDEDARKRVFRLRAPIDSSPGASPDAEGRQELRWSSSSTACRSARHGVGRQPGEDLRSVDAVDHALAEQQLLLRVPHSSRSIAGRCAARRRFRTSSMFGALELLEDHTSMREPVSTVVARGSWGRPPHLRAEPELLRLLDVARAPSSSRRRRDRARIVGASCDRVEQDHHVRSPRAAALASPSRRRRWFFALVERRDQHLAVDAGVRTAAGLPPVARRSTGRLQTSG